MVGYAGILTSDPSSGFLGSKGFTARPMEGWVLRCDFRFGILAF